MNCFSCFQSQKSQKSFSNRENATPMSPKGSTDSKNRDDKKRDEDNENKTEVAAQTFTFREMATATRNFRQECLLGEGGFGRVFKGTLAATGQVVAVKQLDRSGLQENKDFVVEVTRLSVLHHPNLVGLVGYCGDGDQRLLVYDFVKGGSLHDHLLDLTPEMKPLDWFTRMRIGFGAAKGLEYLHDEANPPVIDGNIKPSNILLDEDSNPLLSDFGLVKLGTAGDKMQMNSRLMGTYGYSAPEYSRGSELSVKSDVYSFGVILLELISGRKAIDTTKPINEQNLVAWAQPIFRDPKRFPDMADPTLNRRFPEKDLNQAVAIAAMCLQEEPAARPLMSDVVTALSFLSMSTDECFLSPPPNQKLEDEDNKESGAGKKSMDASTSRKGSKSRRSRDGVKNSSETQYESVRSSNYSSRESQMRNRSLSHKSSMGSKYDSDSDSDKGGSSRRIHLNDMTESDESDDDHSSDDEEDEDEDEDNC